MTRPAIRSFAPWSFRNRRLQRRLPRSMSVRSVKSCIKSGADPNAFGKCGAWTRPLNRAARTSDADVIRALLEAGADPNARDEDGDTALHDAARYGKAGEKLEALLEGGADPALRNNAGKLPWDYARANEALRESSVLERLRPSAPSSLNLRVSAGLFGPWLRCSSLCGACHTASSRLARNQKSLAATLAFLDLTEH